MTLNEIVHEIEKEIEKYDNSNFIKFWNSIMLEDTLSSSIYIKEELKNEMLDELLDYFNNELYTEETLKIYNSLFEENIEIEDIEIEDKEYFEDYM